MKIGIFIGCFNPVHSAHIRCAEELFENKFVDKIIFVPVGDEYEKQGLVSANFRLKMLGLAINENPNFEVSDIEVERGKLYTYQTLDYFKNLNSDDEIILIIGTDNLKEFHSWQRADYILNTYKIIVLTRDNLSKNDFLNYAKYSNIIFYTSNKPVSSTKIREMIKAKNYELASQNLDKSVLEYIMINKLYEE